ncbi:MAG: hypothetical protein Q4B54_03475 [Coriobacteriales bacterium]|nr:hypothetical protein [Coriobacteriales bacterium]
MMNMHRLGTLAVSFALVGSMGLCACGSQQASSQSSSAASEATSQKSSDGLKAIGTAQEGGLDILLTNALTTPIASLTLSEAGSDAYGDNLMASGQTLAANEQAHLLLDSSYAADKTYDLRASMDGGSFFDYKNLPLANIQKLSLHDADGYAYLEYTLKDGSVVSNKAEAEAQRDAAQAAAMAAAAGTAAMETAQENTTDQNAAQSTDQTTDQSSADTQVSEPAAYEAPAETVYVETAPAQEAPAQSTDSCLGDDVVLR